MTHDSKFEACWGGPVTVIRALLTTSSARCDWVEAASAIIYSGCVRDATVALMMANCLAWRTTHRHLTDRLAATSHCWELRN